LKTWWGRLTDGGYYFLMVGAEVGRFGSEASLAQTVPLQDLLKLGEDMRERLKAAGFEEEPALHVQMEAEY